MNETKPKAAIYWAGSCGGCDVSLVSIPKITLHSLNNVQVAFWPAATDYKYDDLRNLANEELALTLFNGAIRTEENEKIATLLRKKSELLVAFGSCACEGGIPGLANLSNRDDIFTEVYQDNPTTPGEKVPQEKSTKNGVSLTLPKFYDRVKPLSEVVEVDYFLPGCPPPKNLVRQLIENFLNESMPKPGSILAGQNSVCDQCSREWEQESVSEFVRPHKVEIDPEDITDHLEEQVAEWTYVKFPYLKQVGWNGLEDGSDSGMLRVGPLARLNVARGMKTSLAQQEYDRYMEYLDGSPVHSTYAYHWVRLIELIQSAERTSQIADNNQLTEGKLRNSVQQPREGVGIIEAARGTLIHHYQLNQQGLINKANMIVPTTINNAAMSLSIRNAAKELIDSPQVEERI